MDKWKYNRDRKEGICGKSQSKSGRTWNKIASIVRCAGIFFVVAVLAMTLIVTVPSVMGYHVYCIQSESMEPEYPKNSLIFVKEMAEGTGETGDVITFYQNETGNATVTHRIVSVNADGTYSTKGDANAEADSDSVNEERVIGKAAVCIPGLGTVYQLASGWRGKAGIFLVLMLSVLSFALTDRREGKREEKRKGAGSMQLAVPGMILAVCIMFFALAKLAGIWFTYQKAVGEYQELAETYTWEENPGGETAGGSDVSELPEWQTFRVDFDGLREINSEVIAWIRFDHLDISYPVLQTEDDATYLKKTFEGEENSSGAIFMETENAGDFSDSYTILYGHNMKNGTMFGKLKNYKTQEKCYEENPYFTVYTPEEIRRYEVAAFCDVDADSEVYTVGFEADDVFEDFLNQRLRESYVDTGVELTSDNQVLVLSTCSTTGKRFILVAKQILVQKY